VALTTVRALRSHLVAYRAGRIKRNRTGARKTLGEQLAALPFLREEKICVALEGGGGHYHIRVPKIKKGCLYFYNTP